MLRACRPLDRRLSTPPTTLGKHILKHRVELGLFQRQVAEQLGVDEASVHNWEAGKREPELRFLPAIYSWLGYCPVNLTPSTLGARVRRQREANGLSRLALAACVGLDSTTLWRIETDRNRAPTARVLRIVKTLLAEHD